MTKSAEELCFTSACELVNAYRTKSISPLAVTEAVLERIEKLNPVLNAFCYTDPASSLAAAQASEQRWEKGEPLGLLDGVPVSVKDLLLAKGWPTLKGSRTINPAGPWLEDDPAVARLREHGAVLLGKTTTPEFGCSGITNPLLTGLTVNPWDTNRTTGGSSGGSVAAVAAGLGQCSLGTDSGGSVRTPSSFCGLVGMKPTFGRVPQLPGDSWGRLSVTGPIARTVADIALMMNVLTLPDARDWNARKYEDCDYLAALESDLSGLRIAFSLDLGYMPVDKEVAAIVTEAAKRFEDLGAEVVEADPDFGNPMELFIKIWCAQLYHLSSTFNEEQMALLEDETLGYLNEGRNISLLEYIEAQSRQAQTIAKLNDFHETYDLLLTPTALVSPFKNGNAWPPNWDLDRFLIWELPTWPFNLTGQPAISVPCGFTEKGLPVGMQIIGAIDNDLKIMQAAHAYQKAFSFVDRRPELST